MSYLSANVSFYCDEQNKTLKKRIFLSISDN